MTLVIDIGSQYIHLIQRKKMGKLRCQSIRIPTGSIVDGEIVSLNEITRLIKKGIERKCYQKKEVIFLVHTSQMIMKETKLSKVRCKKMQNLIEEEMAGIESKEEPYLIDYQVTEVVDKQTSKCKIIAIPKKIITNYIQLSKALGIKNCKIDIHQNSIIKLIGRQKLEKEKTIVLVEVGSSTLHVHLFEGTTHIFSNHIPINTQQYKETLVQMGQLRDEEAFLYLDVSPASLLQNPALFNLLTPYLTSILDQIQNMLQFQLSRSSQNPVSAVYLYGEMANMKGIIDYLAGGLLIEVKEARELIKEFKTDELNNYLAGLGEIYSDQNKSIDFYKVYRQVEKNSIKFSLRTSVPKVILLGQMIMGTSIVAYYLLAGRYNNEVADKLIAPYVQKDTVLKLHSLYETSQQIEELKVRSEQLEKIGMKLEEIPKLDKIFWNQIKKQMPKQVTIRKMSYQPYIITLECEAILEKDLLDFIYHLRKLPYLQEVYYRGYDKEEGTYYFTLDLVVKGD